MERIIETIMGLGGKTFGIWLDSGWLCGLQLPLIFERFHFHSCGTWIYKLKKSLHPYEQIESYFQDLYRSGTNQPVFLTSLCPLIV